MLINDIWENIKTLDTLPLVVDLNEKLVWAPCTKVGEHNLIVACNSLSCPHFSSLNSPKIVTSCGLLITTLFI